MAQRRHEKLGWTLGWMGGFLWVLILSVVFFAQGKVLQASLGLALTGAACVAITRLSPWRHAHTSYRRLMAPIYILFFAAVVWSAWGLPDLRQLGFNSPWALFSLLPILMPLWTVGDRRWEDGDPR